MYCRQKAMFALQKGVREMTRKACLITFLVAAVIAVCPLGTVLLEAAALRVVDPNGGEKLIAGQTYPIAWQSEGGISRVLIEYSSNNGSSWSLIDPNAPNTGTYGWVVPRVTSDQCLARLSDISNPDVNDTSDGTFTIYVCPLLFDLNYDCIVNFADFVLLASEWLVDGTAFLFFNYTIEATGTEDVMTYPDQNFTWTVTTTATESWMEYDSNSLYVSCQGYRAECYYYLYPTDRSYQIYDWGYSDASSLYGGANSGTYIDAANNRLAIRAYSGGDQNTWCCGGYIFGVCRGWCTDYYDGYWRATYHINARKTVSATRTRTQSGPGTVNATEGLKFIGNFDLDPPLAEQGGTVTIDSFSVETNNPRVAASIVVGDTGEVYASTEYSQIVSRPWSHTQTGSAVILPAAGPKYIVTCTLTAPNNDTSWSVTNDNQLVNSWMVGSELYAEVP